MSTDRLPVADLYRWFQAHSRDLPWRRMRDPYAIWVSEIMLQQTQVRTVIPYFERWMQHLPTVRHLAEAPEPSVLKLWEGLGYYSRVRNLQRAARRVLESREGQMPRARQDWLDLPGVGRYTAGAIRSIAFNEPDPILDGNIQRVLSRYEAIDTPPKASGTLTRLWNRAEVWIQAAHALERDLPQEFPEACRTINQALMELGSLACTPKAPSCHECPVATGCKANALGHPERFPAPQRRPPVIRQYRLVLQMHRPTAHGTCWWVVQRPTEGINASLWEFPNWEIPESAARHPGTWIRTHLDLDPSALEPVCRVTHGITHHRITQLVFRFRVDSGQPPIQPESLPHVPHQSRRWVAADELEGLAFTAAHRRIVRHLTTGDRSTHQGAGLVRSRNRRTESGSRVGSSQAVPEQQ